MCRAGKLFDRSRVLKSYFIAYVLPNFEYCAPVWMSSADFYLSLLVIEWFAMWKGCVRVNFVVWVTEEGPAPCVCAMRFIKERTSLCKSIRIISLQFVIIIKLQRSGRFSFGDQTLQKLSIQSVVSPYCCCSSVELADVWCVLW